MNSSIKSPITVKPEKLFAHAPQYFMLLFQKFLNGKK